MRLLSLKAAIFYIAISSALHFFQTIFLWGIYFNTITGKPVYPILHYLNQTLPNPIIILSNYNIYFLPLLMILIPVLNILGLIISIVDLIKSKKGNAHLLSRILIFIAVFQWLIFLYFLFFRNLEI
jgi:hypothetical protein